MYSGDTRPCDNLVRLGRGCQLLVHEATFDDSKRDHALRKKHSTVSEAIDVARRMECDRLVLMHFSQRCVQPHDPMTP